MHELYMSCNVQAEAAVLLVYLPLVRCPSAQSSVQTQHILNRLLTRLAALSLVTTGALNHWEWSLVFVMLSAGLTWPGLRLAACSSRETQARPSLKTWTPISQSQPELSQHGNTQMDLEA